MSSQILVSLRVKTSPLRAFELFTRDIALWWTPHGLFQFTPGSPGCQASLSVTSGTRRGSPPVPKNSSFARCRPLCVVFQR